MILRPPHIIDEHWQEWVVGSQVDPELTSLNLHSLEGTTAYDYLLYGLDESERRNDGRLRDSWLLRYAHIEAGGWWCSGINVLTGKEEWWGKSQRA